MSGREYFRQKNNRCFLFQIDSSGGSPVSPSLSGSGGGGDVIAGNLSQPDLTASDVLRGADLIQQEEKEEELNNNVTVVDVVVGTTDPLQGRLTVRIVMEMIPPLS